MFHFMLQLSPLMTELQGFLKNGDNISIMFLTKMEAVLNQRDIIISRNLFLSQAQIQLGNETRQLTSCRREERGGLERRDVFFD